MKLLVSIFFFVLLQLFSMAQYKSIDRSFSDKGFLLLHEDSFTVNPFKLIKILDSYYMFCNTRQVRYGGGIQQKIWIYRLASDFTVDREFGVNGKVVVDSVTKYSFTNMLELANGGLLYAGANDNNYFISKLKYDFTVDASFANGKGKIPIQKAAYTRVNREGEIYSISVPGVDINNIARINKYNGDGLADVNFGTKALKITNFRKDEIYTVVIENNNKILIAGRSYDNLPRVHPFILRLLPNGDLDSTFANNGLLLFDTAPLSDYAEVIQLSLDQEGNIYAGCNAVYLNGTGGGEGTYPLIAKILPNGELDESYGNNGLVAFPQTTYGANDYVYSITLDSNNRLIFAGGASYPFPYNVTSARLTAIDGTGRVDEAYFDKGTFLYDNDTSRTTVVEQLEIMDNKLYAFNITYSRAFNTYSTLIYRFDLLNSIKERAPYASLALFPNPSKGNLSFTFPTGDKPQDIKVLNTLGQLVQNIPAQALATSGNTWQFNTEALAAGQYLLQITGNEGMVNKPFVKIE